MKIFAGFFVFFITIVLGEIYDCETNKTVNLKLNEISFFETTNFPKLMTKKEFKLCSLKFDYVGKKTAKYELIVSYAEIGFTPGKKPDYNTVSDTYSKSAYHLKSSSSHKYIGQQGYIIFIKRTKTCRLESITRKKPFEFKNEKQMFYFQSDVHTNEYARPPCEWNFLAPLGYGFKIIIEDIAASVTIRNTTDLLVNDRSMQLQYPYYNSDKEIQISISDDYMTSYSRFYGYVTIVKEAPKKIDGNCNVIENDGEIIWTNIRPDLEGYINNAYCSYNLLIKPNTTILVDIQILCLERNVDVVRYHPDEFNFVILEQSEIDLSSSDVEFILNSYSNGSERNVLWEFESDGSVQGFGFKISFNELLCGCANPLVECDNKIHFIMNGSYFYCGNLICNFTIKPCSSNLTLIHIVFDTSDNYILDLFTVISNNIIIWKTNVSNSFENFKIYVNSSYENIFQAITTQTQTIKSLSFTLEFINDPVVDLRIILSPNFPSYVLNTGLHNVTTFKIDGALDSSFLLVNSNDNGFSLLNGLSLFNNESLTYNLKNDDCFNSIQQCTIRNNEFVVFFDTQNYGYLGVQLSGGKKGCVFKKHIFVADDTITALATFDEDCIITVIGQMTSSNIWTTAKYENIEIYSDEINQNNLLFKTNSRSINRWNDLIFYINVIKIKIPKRTTFYYFASTEDSVALRNPYRAVICYENSLLSTDDGYINYSITDVPLRITVLKYNMPYGKRFWIKANKIKHIFNNVSDTMVFKNQKIVLGYDIFERKAPEFRPEYVASFFIETISL